MQLKVPPKEAVNLLTEIIQKGDNFLIQIEKDYFSIPEKIEEVNQKAVEEMKQSNRRHSGKTATIIKIPNEKAFSIIEQVKESVLEAQRRSQEIMKNTLSKSILSCSDEIGLEEKDEFYVNAISKYKQEKNEWEKQALEVLNAISGDYVWLRKYAQVEKKVYNKMLHFPLTREDPDDKYEEYINLKNEVLAENKFLQELYIEIEKEMKSPLFYIKDRSTLCYYDFVCELQADTNESLLCEYMFQFSIGSKKEIADIYKFMTGEEFLKGDEKIVKNALEGVNKKTKEFLGFSRFLA